MKKVFLFLLVLFIPFCFTSCKKSSVTYRMKEITYVVDNENVTILASDLKSLIDSNYEPYGGLEDNYFFCLAFSSNSNGKAIFVFSELGPDFVDVVADNFVVEEKSNGHISLIFTNGASLSGNKYKNTLYLKGNGVSYIFEKI